MLLKGSIFFSSIIFEVVKQVEICYEMKIKKNTFSTLQICWDHILKGAIHVSLFGIISDHRLDNMNFILTNFNWHAV